ncbi:unnamed protein product [Sphenostylis stenocarpa]|uniref:Uncharacterized protein n=1 Tax=Sphenostylis stenocarpa TaxID=92480 RepID=A0AA86S8N5_9FABA|nr:unnamed protein product [Sphenostylis stenocarpa]
MRLNMQRDFGAAVGHPSQRGTPVSQPKNRCLLVCKPIISTIPLSENPVTMRVRAKLLGLLPTLHQTILLAN